MAVAVAVMGLSGGVAVAGWGSAAAVVAGWASVAAVVAEWGGVWEESKRLASPPDERGQLDALQRLQPQARTVMNHLRGLASANAVTEAASSAAFDWALTRGKECPSDAIFLSPVAERAIL